jgi:hypothetical protein
MSQRLLCSTAVTCKQIGAELETAFAKTTSQIINPEFLHAWRSTYP